jgi:hypothetical protein
MKKVVLPSLKSNELIEPRNCVGGDNFVYGIELRREKGIIVEFRKISLYRCIEVGGVYIGSHWGDFDSDSLQTTIEKALERGAQVYQFKDRKEFARWLLED